MTDAISEFFDELRQRVHEPLLKKATGTVRFDLEHGKGTDRWLVAVTKGDLAVSRRNQKADSVVRMDRALFDQIVRGKANTMTAMLRGVASVQGDIGLLANFQRLFPGPSGPPGRRSGAGEGRSRE